MNFFKLFFVSSLKKPENKPIYGQIILIFPEVKKLHFGYYQRRSAAHDLDSIKELTTWKGMIDGFVNKPIAICIIKPKK